MENDNFSKINTNYDAYNASKMQKGFGYAMLLYFKSDKSIDELELEYDMFMINRSANKIMFYEGFASAIRTLRRANIRNI